jgi:predicted TIM-barrel fold metal-dependent hydrolase
MRYRAISADGHINEPVDLWTSRLPARFRDRGPRVIDTEDTQGQAWIMEGQREPARLGFTSIFHRSSKRFDRASLVDSFNEIKDRGVRYDDIFPGSWDPAARLSEITEDGMDAEVLYNGVLPWNGIKLCEDRELSLACYQAYNDWAAEFQGYAPDRFVHNGTLPTTGLAECVAELRRCHEMGLRSVQLESYPSGSYVEPSPEDDRFWATAVELDMPIAVHTMFFFPFGDLGGAPSTRGAKAAQLGLDVAQARFETILFKLICSGVFERFPTLRLVGAEVWVGWIPYYLERFDDSVRRNRHDWRLPLLPSEYFHRNVSVVYVVDEIGVEDVNRYAVGIENIMWGPDFPHSTSNWPVDTELGLEFLERGGATAREIERIMWRNAAELYRLPWEEPDTGSVIARAAS